MKIRYLIYGAFPTCNNFFLNSVPFSKSYNVQSALQSMHKFLPQAPVHYHFKLKAMCHPYCISRGADKSKLFLYKKKKEVTNSGGTTTNNYLKVMSELFAIFDSRR